MNTTTAQKTVTLSNGTRFTVTDPPTPANIAKDWKRYVKEQAK